MCRANPQFLQAWSGLHKTPWFTIHQHLNLKLLLKASTILTCPHSVRMPPDSSHEMPRRKRLYKNCSHLQAVSSELLQARWLHSLKLKSFEEAGTLQNWQREHYSDSLVLQDATHLACLTKLCALAEQRPTQIFTDEVCCIFFVKCLWPNLWPSLQACGCLDTFENLGATAFGVERFTSTCWRGRVWYFTQAIVECVTKLCTFFSYLHLQHVQMQTNSILNKYEQISHSWRCQRLSLIMLERFQQDKRPYAEPLILYRTPDVHCPIPWPVKGAVASPAPCSPNLLFALGAPFRFLIPFSFVIAMIVVAGGKDNWEAGWSTVSSSCAERSGLVRKGLCPTCWPAQNMPRAAQRYWPGLQYLGRRRTCIQKCSQAGTSCLEDVKTCGTRSRVSDSFLTGQDPPYRSIAIV